MLPSRLVEIAGHPEEVFADFRNFVHYIFTEVRGWTVGPTQYDVAQFMQDLPMSPDNIRRGQVQCARGYGKSELVNCYALWLQYLDPEIKIIVLCSVDRKAQEHIALARAIIDAAPLLHHLRPQLARDGVVDKDQKDNLHGFVNGAVTKPSKELSMGCYAIFGTYTGSHPDVVIADDVETPENSLTIGKRDKLMSKVHEVEHLINPGGIIMVLGTPQSLDSVYNRLKKDHYPICRWPAEYPNLADPSACRDVTKMFLGKLARGEVKAGDPTYPERFDRAALMHKAAIYGSATYALQMLLDTTLSDANRYPLKLSNLIVMECHAELAPEQVVGKGERIADLDPPGLQGDYFRGPAYKAPKFAPYQSSIMIVDPKGRGEDTVGYCVLKTLNGIIYCTTSGGLASGRGNDGTSEPVMEKLSKVALMQGVKVVHVEDNFGDGMYSKLLRPVIARINGPTEVVDHKSHGMKEARIIDTLQPLTEQGRLVVDRDVAKNNELMVQYSHIFKARGALRHDDLIDVLAIGCSILSPQVAVDPERKVQAAETAELDRIAKAFIRDPGQFYGVKVKADHSRQGWVKKNRWGTRPARR